MSITINANKINLFQNQTIIKANNKANNDSNKKTDENKTNINIKADNKNKQSSLMENLLKQKDSLNEKKQTLMGKEMNAEEKKSKIDDINKQIQAIEAQIQQLNIQEKQEEVQKKEDEALKAKAESEKYAPDKNVDEVRDDIIISASLNELIKLNSSNETIHLLKDSKNRQLVEAGYIKPNDDPNSYNNRRLAQISRSIPNLDMAVSKNIGDLNKSAERIKYKTKLATDEIKNKLEEEKESNNKLETESNEENLTNGDDKKINEEKKKITS